MTIADTLMHSRWFARQPPALRAALVQAGRVVPLAPGQWVYGEGDDETGLCAVLSGALRLEATAGDRDVLVDVARAVTVFGQSARRGGGPRIVTARAGPASEVMLVSDHALERIAADLPDLWRGVSALVYAQLDASVHRMAQMLVLPPRARVLARVRSLARGGVARVSQADLAELTGLSRKTVNEHLGALAAAGVVRCGHGAVTLVDSDG